MAKTDPLAALGNHAKRAAYVAYLDEMSRPNTYGTEVELEALSRLLHRPIHIFRVESYVQTKADGSKQRAERVPQFAEAGVGDLSSDKAPITLKHITYLDEHGRNYSNANHYEMVAGLKPSAQTSFSLETIKTHTQPIRGDGSCLFRAVSLFLQMEKEAQGGLMRPQPNRQETNDHERLRAEVVDWQRSHATATVFGGMLLIDLAVP